MALNKGRFYPPGGYLATGYISVVKLEWSGRRKGKWHPVGRGQGCYLPPYNAQDRPPPTARNSYAQNVNSVQVGRPYCIVTFLKRKLTARMD